MLYNNEFFLAARNGDIDSLIKFLDSGIDINAIRANPVRIRHVLWESALLVAVRNKQIAAVKLLLSRGANIDSTNHQSSDVFLVAVLSGHDELVNLLCSYGKTFITPLHEAAYRGELDKLRSLLSSQPELAERRDNERNTLLDYAAASGQIAVVEFLVHNKPSIFKQSYQLGKALQIASANGHLELVTWLSMHGASINEYGYSALFYAATNGQLEIVKWLFANGIGLNDMEYDGEEAEYTALLGAADNGHIETVKWLLANGALFEFETIVCAVSSRNLELVKWLLANGASLAGTDEFGNTALLKAACIGDLELVKWLLANGASLTERNRYSENTALLIAVENGNSELVKWLLANGASLTERDKSGNTALLKAAIRGNSELVKWLLANGASLTERDKSGNTALLKAAISGNSELVKWLLANGASLIERDESGNTALLNAAQRGNSELVKWLLANGASLTERDKSGNTVLLTAARRGNLALVKWLVANRASLAERNEYGYTTLIQAVREGNLELVEWLVINGAPLTNRNKYNESALAIAVSRGYGGYTAYIDIANYLLSIGAAIGESFPFDNKFNDINLSTKVVIGMKIKGVNVQRGFDGFQHAVTTLAEFQLHKTEVKNYPILLKVCEERLLCDPTDQELQQLKRILLLQLGLQYQAINVIKQSALLKHKVRQYPFLLTDERQLFLEASVLPANEKSDTAIRPSL